MFYIKLDNDMNLTITQREPIYRGDNLNQKITYLIPAQVGEIDILTAYVYLNYIRADGVADVVVLERMENMYNDAYFQYTFPVTCRLSKYPGEVCTWMQIYTGTPSNPTVAKSGECMLQIQDSKNMDDYICDHQLTALYQIHKSMEDSMAEMDKTMDENIAKINEDVSKKADGLSYNEDTRELQLKSGDNAVGDVVTVPSDKYREDIADEVEDTWSDMTEQDDGSENTESWEPM